MPIPLVAISLGDPAGIGPELVAKVLQTRKIEGEYQPVVIGEPDVLLAGAAVAGVQLSTELVDDTRSIPVGGEAVPVLRPKGVKDREHRGGINDKENGYDAAWCIAEALDPQNGFSSVVLAPMNKESFHNAGYDFADELQYMAHLTGSTRPANIGVMDDVWTCPVSEHIPFSAIRDYVRTDLIYDRITILAKALVESGRGKPRLAVAALNPHAGEGGQLGRDEIDEIEPAVRKARSEGIAVDGPVPADMVFVLAVSGRYDGVVCMYHDQATIPRKLYAKGRGCTVLYGLPVPVTTTAHGTAFDIAGKGQANPGSLLDALTVAVDMARES